MNIENIKELIYNILIAMGIYIEKTNKDVDLTEYIADSLDYISFFVELEEALDIELPDDLFLMDTIKSINALSQKIELLLLAKQMESIECNLDDEDDTQR